MSFDLELCEIGDLVGAGVGWRLANDDWDAGRRRERREELAAWAPPKRRERRPTLESQVRQLFRAARAAGVTITVTIEGPDGVRLTVTPAGRSTPSEPALDEAPRRSLFTIRAVPKQKVVL